MPSNEVMVRVEELREKRGWSQVELAKKAKINPVMYNLIVNGKRRLRAEHVDVLAAALGVDVVELYGGVKKVEDSDTTIKIELTKGELRALLGLAADDLRTPENYARKILVDHIRAKKLRSDDSQ
jgi:transcriptional regulator with XRE-family HTH domain